MNNIFPLLAIETSGELCSTALFLDEKKYSEYSIRLKHVHSEKLLLMINELMSSLIITAKELKCVAVSEGPGSFTGLRIGMAAAKGIAMGSGIPFIAVPTFEAYAYKVSKFLQDRAVFSVVNNVNVEELYFARYKKNTDSITNVDELRIIKKTDFISEDELIFGNYSNLHDDKQLIEVPSGFDIGVWAYKFGKDLLTYNYDFIEPKYLKDFVARIKK